MRHRRPPTRPTTLATGAASPIMDVLERAPRPARLAHADVPRVYRRIAPTHDLMARLFEARARRLALDWAAVQDGEQVLELAVGTGLAFSRLLRQNPSGFTRGLDRTPAMLARARRRAARAGTDRYELRLADVFEVELGAGLYDLVFCGYLFDLLPVAHFEPLLAAIRRALRPGGRLVVVGMTRPQRRVEALWEALYRLHPAFMGGCRGVEMAPFLEVAGFGAVRRAFVSQRTFPSEVVLGHA